MAGRESAKAGDSQYAHAKTTPYKEIKSAGQMILQRELIKIVKEDKEEAVEAFRSYLGSVWDEDAMFFNYLEGLQFASACADVVATGNPLTEERMSKILKAQAVVMTVRGQVREEYKASMGLYRL